MKRNSCLQRTKIREAIESLQKEINTAQDTQFQIKEGIDWTRLHKLREAATFTVMSTRHLSDQERNALALELMSFRIKYFFLSKAQVMLKLEGMEIEVLRNLLHCSTTYWGGPPLGVQILYTFPTPKMGIKQIEQFSDIILRILRFLAESSGVAKLELFQRFPHCK